MAIISPPEFDVFIIANDFAPAALVQVVLLSLLAASI